MMKKIKPLVKPPAKQNLGLQIDCNGECHTLVHSDSICPKTGKPYTECDPTKQNYKVIGYEKNSATRRAKNLKTRRTKNLMTRDLKTALIEAAIFQKQVKEGAYNKEEKVEEQHVPIIEKQEDSPLLLDAMAKHVAFLKGKGVPEHQRRVRGKLYCKEVHKVYLDFIKSIKDFCNVKELTINQLDPNMVGKFHAWIESKNLGPRSYNLMMTRMNSLYKYLTREGLATANPFSGVVHKIETHDIAVLTKEEYEALLDIVQIPELGICKVGKENKDFFRPWIKLGIQIGIMTGRRGEEIVRMRWKDIVLDKQGEMLAVNVTDYKVSRQQGRLESNPKKISVPITEELKQLLREFGYEKFKDSNKYILADEEEMSRDTMRKFMSRSFSHYWKHLNFPKEASYKTLRKTYLSSLAAEIGISNARIISQHSDTKVLETHYVNDRVIGQTAKNFSVFPSQSEERQKELHKLRKSTNEISLEK